jgi:hypothetical protein
MGFKKPYVCHKAMHSVGIYIDKLKRKESILVLRKQLFSSSEEEGG